jgi:hypothetical protein
MRRDPKSNIKAVGANSARKDGLKEKVITSTPFEGKGDNFDPV